MPTACGGGPLRHTRRSSPHGRRGVVCYGGGSESDGRGRSRGIKDMWGLPAGAHIEYGVWGDRVHAEDLARVEAAVGKGVDPNGDGVFFIEYRVNGMDGMERW